MKVRWAGAAGLFLAMLFFGALSHPRPRVPPPGAHPAQADVPAPDHAPDHAPAAGHPGAAGTPPALAPIRGVAWPQQPPEPAFATFADWTRRHAAAAPGEKARLEQEGIALARQRLGTLAHLVQTNPARALELEVPSSVRSTLPASVTALLEQPVNTRGDLEVICFYPVPGAPPPAVPIVRYAVVGGERSQVFTYGRGLEFVTKKGVPLNGFRIPAEAATLPPAPNGLPTVGTLMALHETPVRLLDPAEVTDPRRPVNRGPDCLVRPDAPPVALAFGGRTLAFCCRTNAEAWAGAAVAAEGMNLPAPPENLTPAASSYTEGRKKMLLLRPYWSDQAVAMGTNAALNHFANFSNYMHQMSYGKLVFAALRQGSDISPEILMPGSVAGYSSGLGTTFTAVKDVARTNYGLDSADYDFVYYVTGSQPPASYAGLGFVGGVGFHLANGYFDAATSGHEFGHNLGLNHANFWQTTPRTLIGNGTSVEYGDSTDPMGGGGDPNQFSSRYKNLLDWIPGSDVADLNALGSGTYRLYAFDLDTGVGRRGLKFARSGSQNYWVQFRQRITGSRSLMNGVQLLWTGNGNGSSLLLDARLTGGAGNNGLVIGRTFSDSALGFHVTPVGKGHTHPESIDVVVHIGSFPTNVPPVATVRASATTAAAGQSLTFTASATDANGDALAYAWTFDDGDYSVDNSPTAMHSFAAAGEYTVHCAISDLRGGVAHESVVVRIGNPATFRISGRVFNAQGRPLAGILVSADATHSASSDSDGSYTITDLPAGSYTLGAQETVTGTTSFITPFFANPVTVGPGAVNRDFMVGTPAPVLTLVAPGAVWKYLDLGTDPGPGWTGTNFNDGTWASGPAQLGYGEGDEATVISFGPNAGAKYTTTHFRLPFTVANPAAYTNLTVGVLRDDGVIVYLNGTEVFRSNMPTGAVTTATFASAAIDDTAFFTGAIPSTLLRAGTNLLAAELHQADLTTSDASFDLKLTAESATNAVSASLVYLTAPENGDRFGLPTNLTLAANALISGGSFTNVEFLDGGVKAGEDATAPYSLSLNNPAAGLHTLTAIAVTSTGVRRTSAPIAITVSVPLPPTTSLTLVPAGSTWRYLAGASAAPAAWTNLAFNDSAWPAGPAELGFGDGGEATVVPGGPATNVYPTLYFRRAFTVQDPAAITNLALQLKRDDGAVVYLNGREVVRDNLPNGVITYATLASVSATDDGATFLPFTLDPGTLRVGTNLLAVEVHQSSATSSDLSFDLALAALATTNRARGCWLVSPTQGASLPLPGLIPLAAQVVAGGTLGVDLVEFFANGTKIGQTSVQPFVFPWTQAAPGIPTLTAVATDSAGGSITSAPVSLTLLPPPAGTALVSFGDVWKYLDDGTDAGTAWRSRTYNDSLWAAGPARLGYGGDGEVTTVSFGPNPAAKAVTTYFRRAFTVVNPAAFSGLFLQVLRDDGVVVHLNGTEVFRDNLQAGLVSWNSLAWATVDAPAETTPLEVLLPTTGLLAGTNVIAVEIHQASLASSDLGFDLALTALDGTNSAAGLYLSSPAAGAHFNSPARIPLGAVAADPAAVTLVEYFAGATRLGEASNPPYALTWSNAPVGTHVLTARATEGGGLLRTSAPLSIVVGDPPPPITPVYQVVVPTGGSWKYWDNVTPVAANWAARTADDSAWPAGPARFGWGLDGERTVLTEGRVTHYFRRGFTLTNPAVLSELVFDLQRDDGAVVYVNGLEVFRSNMPAGPVTAATLASSSVNTPDETTFYRTVTAVAGMGLTTGSNVIAVELHQGSATSSDAGFDLQLAAVGTSEPRLYFATPTNHTAVSSSSNLTFALAAWPGTGRSVARVDLLADGAPLAAWSSEPYRFTWSSPPFGPHLMTARLTDNTGALVETHLQVAVTRELVTSTLLASNAVWRYTDAGVAPPTNWFLPAFNDDAWKTGPARLGFGGDGEATVLAGQPVITYYFRRTFAPPAGVSYTNLTFNLVRDDGAVVYLNGREAFRTTNMPAGPITYNSRPLSSVGGADEQTFFPTVVTLTNLPAGTNLVAVEVHQFDGNSSDLGFNLELVGRGYLESQAPPVVAIILADGLIELSWPSSYSGWGVYSAPSVNTPAAGWQPQLGSTVLVGNRFILTVAPSAATQFFRLGRP